MACRFYRDCNNIHHISTVGLYNIPKSAKVQKNSKMVVSNMSEFHFEARRIYVQKNSFDSVHISKLQELF